MPNRLTRWIIHSGWCMGILSGYIAHAYFTNRARAYADVASLLPPSFLRLIKMIIAPLVLATLIVGIAQHGGHRRPWAAIGGKALGVVHLRLADLADAGARSWCSCSSPA